MNGRVKSQTGRRSDFGSCPFAHQARVLCHAAADATPSKGCI